MSKCPNCGASITCGCQKRTLPNGSQGCSSCLGKTQGASKAPVIQRTKPASKPAVTIEGKAPVSNIWGPDRYKNLNKFTK